MACNIRVELKSIPHYATKEQKEKAFRGMFAAFKRKINESGILTEYKERQTYETQSERKRRKTKEAELRKKKEKLFLKSSIRQNFGI